MSSDDVDVSRSFVDDFLARHTPTGRIETAWQNKPLPGNGTVHVREHTVSSNISLSPSASLLTEKEKETSRPIGVPRRKKRVDPLDFAALLVSITCCVLAIVSVQNDYFAWRLRVGNQLIVVGFLLSIMSLCLDRTSSYLFLLLEARFGRSTLQNFDGILHNQMFAAKLDMVWRFLLFCSLALPILLSVGYKRFIDGTSGALINATAVTALPPEYGLFTVPDINTARGSGWPLSIYFNASLPFRLASSLPVGTGTEVYGPEPLLPASYPAPYGANTLLLSDHSTALLDLPRATRLSALQQSLPGGDAVDITASVHGTVATENTSLAPKDDPAFITACYNSSMVVSSVSLVNPQGFGVNILAPDGTNNQSTFWLALAPFNNPWSSHDAQCDSLAQYAKRYDITRRNCTAHWSVTRGGIELVNGTCESGNLPTMQQAVFQMNTFYLGSTFGTLMAEALGVFSNVRPDSQWKDPSMATFAASITWAAFMSLNDQANRPDTVIEGNFGYFFGALQTNGALGVIYDVPNEVVYAKRSTLKKSTWLLLIFAAQPILTLLSMVGATMMYATPVDRGFGLVSILAGINRNTLDPLRGASLSGKLQRDVQISIFPVHPKDGSQTAIEYRVGTPGDGLRNGRITYGAAYA